MNSLIYAFIIKKMIIFKFVNSILKYNRFNTLLLRDERKAKFQFFYEPLFIEQT
jgi:hypothetical protein